MTHRYGCWNKPRPNSDSFYIAQDGWEPNADALDRKPRWVEIKSAFGTIECQSDLPSLGDKSCDDCINATTK